MRLTRPSASIKNKNRERGSPCQSPCDARKSLVGLPLITRTKRELEHTNLEHTNLYSFDSSVAKTHLLKKEEQINSESRNQILYQNRL